jgi:hypothetical protein
LDLSKLLFIKNNRARTMSIIPSNFTSMLF